MTQLERAVSGSGLTAFSMRFQLGFPAKIISGANPFTEGDELKFGDIVHPDDYQPFCEVINDLVNGSARKIRVHSRLNCGGEFVWYHISGSASRDDNGKLTCIDGVMFNVSGYLDCDTDDAVLKRFRSKHAQQLSLSQQKLSLSDILGEDYLVRIQKPFTQIKGLFSAIVDGGKTISALDKNEKSININKMNYQRKQAIRVRHNDIAFWIIAGNNEEAVNSNAQLLETMVQTVASIANSYVVIVDEMENSQNANKLLGQNFEDQILVNNIYSLILNSKDTKDAMSGIIPLVSEYFGLADMLFCSESAGVGKSYRWDKSGILLPVVTTSPVINSELQQELDYGDIVCTDQKTLNFDDSLENLSCALVRTYENGRENGIVLYIARKSGRSWSNRERKLLKSITHILSTIINKVFIEDKLATSQARLERIAYYDTATGIPNRSMLERDFTAEINSNNSGAIVALEVSNLKSISEIYGCEYSDDILKSFAEYISAVPCSAKKKVYRFSSDILMLMMSKISRDEAQQFAQAILTKFKSPWYLEENEQRLQVYAGVTIYPEDAADIENCIVSATQTLRLAKEKKLQDAVCYSEGLEEQLGNNQLVKKLIADAAENDFKGFYFLYQPVIDINTGALHCCEATLFWENSELTVPRDQFLPIIDRLGLSHELYRYKVDKICEFCAAVRDAGVEQFRVSLTIPENILTNEVSIEAIRASLLEYSLPPSAISISVSEGARTLYNGNIFLRQMAKIGINVIADDLGDGYFTIAPLENPAVKTIKIRSSRFSDDAVSSSFLQSIIRLAHEKEIAVCARGVDSPAIFQNIRKYDVDLVEGTFNGRPLRDREFMEKLVASSPVR